MDEDAVKEALRIHAVELHMLTGFVMFLMTKVFEGRTEAETEMIKADLRDRFSRIDTVPGAASEVTATSLDMQERSQDRALGLIANCLKLAEGPR